MSSCTSLLALKDQNPDFAATILLQRLGDSLSLWAQLLTEIKQTRSTFDNADTQRSFCVCIIDYAMVQSKVNSKYDAWQRDILARYGVKLASAMRDTHSAIAKARNDLEHHSIEGSSTAQAVTFITFVQDLKKSVVKWTPEIADFSAGQQTLERQRYQFPSDWLDVDQVQGEWSAFNEILKRKNDSIQQQLCAYLLHSHSFPSLAHFPCLLTFPNTLYLHSWTADENRRGGQDSGRTDRGDVG